MSLTDKINIAYKLDDPRWSCDGLESLIHQIFEQIFIYDTEIEAYISSLDTLNISLVLTNNAAVQKLNATFRGKDHPTNVLSFPASDYYDTKISGTPPPFISSVQNLGDIVLAYDVMHEEAVQQHKTLKNHFTHLLIHSILHLLGYDHMNEQSAREMETMEVKILAFLEIPDPYHE